MEIDTKQVKVLLAEKELSMKAFCDLNNICYSTFYQIMSGTRTPNLKTVGVIANALGIDVSRLVTNECDDCR